TFAIERVDSSAQLGQRVLGLAERQLREKSETSRIFRNQLGAVIIRSDHRRRGLRPVVREKLRGDAGTIHEIEAGLRREFPFVRGIVAWRAQSDDVEMPVDIDPTARHRFLPRSMPDAVILSRYGAQNHCRNSMW